MLSSYAKIMKGWTSTVNLMKEKINEEKKRRIRESRQDVKKTRMQVKKEEYGEIDDCYVAELEKMKEMARLEEERIFKMREEIKKREIALKEQQKRMEEEKMEELKRREEWKRREELKRVEEKKKMEEKKMEEKKMAEKKKVEELKELKKVEKIKEEKMKNKINARNEVKGVKRGNAQKKDELTKKRREETKKIANERKKANEIKKWEEERRRTVKKQEYNINSGQVRTEKENKSVLKDNAVVDDEMDEEISVIRSTITMKRDNTITGHLVGNRGRRNAVAALKRPVRTEMLKKNEMAGLEKEMKCDDEPGCDLEMVTQKKRSADTTGENVAGVEEKIIKSGPELLQQHLNTLEMNKTHENVKLAGTGMHSVINEGVASAARTRDENAQARTGESIASAARTRNENAQARTGEVNNPFLAANENAKKADVYSARLISALNRDKIEQLQSDVNKRLAEKIVEENKNVLKRKNSNVPACSFSVDKAERVREMSHNEENIDPGLEKMQFHRRMIENSQLVEELMRPLTRKKSGIKISLPKRVSSLRSSSGGDLKDENNSYVRKLNIYRKKHHQTRRQFKRQQILTEKNKKLNQTFEKIKNLFLEKKIRESILVNNSMMDQSVRVEENGRADNTVNTPLFEVPAREALPVSKGPDPIYRRAIDKKISGFKFCTPSKSFDPCTFVPKTTLPFFNAKNEEVFKTSFNKKPWAKEHSIAEIVSNQNHFEIEKYFGVPAIDVCAMFPAVRNISNDSPNRMVNVSK
ncbi:hypothetical protein THOM_0564 [Trachipleistophora hominis]|uniref:Inner centromere protein ARK-binding domain-containing protein n=1 Tax=Trachipleistophora hominis TaxID=72359 RepID=L7JYQ9_TRAHO|nr:hypothetical protein THOM_0564 [Trachipleistophora hominis]